MKAFMKHFVFFICSQSLILFSSLSQSQPLPTIQVLSQTYTLIAKSDGTPGINLEIPYDLGTHKGSAKQADGTVTASTDFQNISGQFEVPIAGLVTGNATRDCHMREAMGLDYTRSHFPKQHVCDSNNQLPTSGDDSVAFPNIQFNLANIQSDLNIGSQLQNIGHSFNVTAKGQWTIHGAQQNTNVVLTITPLNNGVLEIKGDPTFLLTDYNIIVKPILGINVKNQMTAHMDFLVAPKSN